MSDCQYPPYLRSTLKVTPYWKNYKIGDRAYRIDSDDWYVCVKPCVRLEASFEEELAPDYGKTPEQLGYSPGEEYWSLDNWERDTRKLTGSAASPKILDV